MISDKMTKELTKQINAELYSGYLYMAMSSQCAFTGLKGSATWFFVQGQEEMTHALRFYKYLQSQGRQVILGSIEQPPSKFGSLKEMFAVTLEHEKKVTAMIHKLASLAVEEKDFATAILLQWFVKEQVEEEESANDMIVQLTMAGDKGGTLLMIDKHLGKRTFTWPADL
jgi:ferritin